YAEIELHETFIWYEDENAGLGLKFIMAFEECLTKINRNPYFASAVEYNARSASLKKISLDVIYRINEDRQEIKVIAIIHQHRNSNWLKKRLLK
ncbi:MAG TPA: hypothetical protein VGI61_03680, partial [Parafilimonas sp.]